jgi:hypothetical protein
MGSREIEKDSGASPEAQSDSDEGAAKEKGHDDSIIIVASYLYEILGSADE